MRASTAAFAAAMCGVLMLVGCGKESPEPKPLETASTSTTPSPSVSPAPSMPAEAEKKGAKGAEAFVRHYVELINHAQATGDTSSLEQVGASGCGSCVNGVSSVRKVYDEGGHIEGGAWRITSVGAVLPRPDIDGWIVDLQVAFEPQQIHTSDKTQRLKGGTSPFSFEVSRRSTSWIMADWSRGR